MSPVRTGLCVLLSAVISVTVALRVLRLSQPEHRADFLVSVHADRSASWALLIPPETWRTMRRDVRDAHARPVGTFDTARDAVLILVGTGFQHRGFTASGCRVTSRSRAADGVIRYDGVCAWTDEPSKS